jgi:signal peptidase I
VHSERLHTSAGPGSLAGPGPLWLAARVLLGLLVVALLVALALLRAWPPLSLVMSGSMEPAISTGDVAVMQRLDRPAQVGDVVVVHPPQNTRRNLNYPSTVVHRVVAISPQGKVRTKGDARSQPDPFVTPLDRIGTRVVWAIPGVGRIISFFTSPLGLAWLALGLLLFMFIPHLELKRDHIELKRAELGSLAAMRAELRSVAARVEADRGSDETAGTPQ